MFLQATDNSDNAHIYIVGVEFDFEEPFQLSNYPVEAGALKCHSTSGLLGFAAEAFEV